MDIQNVVQIISTVGFPIAMCLLFFWYINKMNEKHADEVNKLSEALQNNTLVMQKLVDKLDGDVK